MAGLRYAQRKSPFTGAYDAPTLCSARCCSIKPKRAWAFISKMGTSEGEGGEPCESLVGGSGEVGRMLNDIIIHIQHRLYCVMSLGEFTVHPSARLRRALECRVHPSARLRRALKCRVHAFGVHWSAECTGVQSALECTPSACTPVHSGRPSAVIGVHCPVHACTVCTLEQSAPFRGGHACRRTLPPGAAGTCAVAHTC